MVVGIHAFLSTASTYGVFPDLLFSSRIKTGRFQAFWNFSKGYLGGFQGVFAGVINRQCPEPCFSRRICGFLDDFLPSALVSDGIIIGK